MQPSESEKKSPPTMTNASLHLPELPQQDPRRRAPELDDSIVARPLVPPDFISVKLANPTLEKRWINYKAGDGMRYQQCLAMGYRNAAKVDIALIGGLPPDKSAYCREGGTKFLNGDLILMVIDRARYLGALKYKHHVAAALSDAAIQKTLSAKRAVRELEQAGAGRSQFAGKMSVFTPGAADLEKTPFAESMKEYTRLGGERAPDDTGGGNG